MWMAILGSERKNRLTSRPAAARRPIEAEPVRVLVGVERCAWVTDISGTLQLEWIPHGRGTGMTLSAMWDTHHQDDSGGQ